MAFKYKLVSRGVQIKGIKEQRQMAVQVNEGTIKTREIAQALQDLTSLGRGDVRNVLEHLGEVVSMYLKLGRSVKLEGLGTFTPRIKSKAVPEDIEYGSHLISGVNMRFTPDKNIKEKIRDISFECVNGVCPAPKAQDHHTSETESPSPLSEDEDDGGEGGY